MVQNIHGNKVKFIGIMLAIVTGLFSNNCGEAITTKLVAQSDGSIYGNAKYFT